MVAKDDLTNLQVLSNLNSLFFLNFHDVPIMKAKYSYKRILIQQSLICPVALWFLITLLTGIPSSLYGQEIPAIITYDRNEYNGGNKNWGFAEDDEGNLYVANTEGIMIFNGMNWQMVHLPNHRVPRSIFRGFDGRIYAGGFETIGYIDRTDPSQPAFIEIGQEILQGTEEEIWHITGSQNQIMFQSFSIIVFYDGQEMNLYTPHDNIMFGQWIDGQLWVPQISKGIYKFDNGREQTIIPRNFPDDAVITGFEKIQNDKLIIATRNQGLYILNDSITAPLNNELNKQLKADQINELIRLKNGDYAIGTIQNGVFITDDFTVIKYHINKRNGLANNTVLSMYETHEGALCIGLNIGLNILKVQDPDLYYYDVEGKLGTIFTAIFHHDHFYVGTNQGVFVQNKQRQFELVPGSQGQAWNLIAVGDDLLCGHNSGTLQLINGQFMLVSPITGGLYMQLLNDHQLLQSTYNGLVLLERKNGLWQDITRISGTDKLIDRFIYKNGEVVGLHPYFGLVYYKLDLSNSQMIYRKIFQDLETKIGNNALGLLAFQNSILVQIDTTLFKIGNFGALEKAAPSLQALIDQKMHSDIEFHILKPINNNSEHRRLIAYFPEKNMAIKSIEEGYVKQYIPSSKPPESQPEIALDFALVNGHLIKRTEQDPELDPTENNLTFQLRNANGFSKNETVSQYRLHPYDQIWNSMPEDGHLEFKQLNHGSYELQVHTNAAEALTLFNFTILPHWYESWPGVLVLFAFCGILVWFVNQRNNKRLKVEKQKFIKDKEAALKAVRIKAKTDKLEHEVAYKSKMLANTAITMIQKNKMLNELKEVIKKESSRSNSVQSVKGKAIKLIDRNLKSDESWEIFDRNFAEVHEDFLERFKVTYPNITPGDLRLAAYIRMNMSSKEIAPILQISVRSVENKRYRLRKKMNLSSDTNLSEHLMRF